MSRIKKFLDDGNKEGLKEYLTEKLGKPGNAMDFESIYKMMKSINDLDFSLDDAMKDFLKEQAGKKRSGFIAIDGEKDGFALFIIKDNEIDIKSSVGPHNALQLLKAMDEFRTELKAKIKKELGED